MRAIRKTGLVTAALAVVLTGCGSHDAPRVISTNSHAVPHIEESGSRARVYRSLSELSEDSSALVVGVPTGERFAVPFPADEGGGPDSAPTIYVGMRIKRVLSGTVGSETVKVVSPGTDGNTGQPALLTGGPYLMYLTPAMYDANDPAGGYALTGGAAGVYAGSDDANVFSRVDTESPDLPTTVDLGSTTPPAVSHSEADLLRRGPR